MELYEMLNSNYRREKKVDDKNRNEERSNGYKTNMVKLNPNLPITS